MSDTMKLVGKLVEGEPGRDAIHVAVVAVVAAHKLMPGDHVGLDEDGLASDQGSSQVGVVDPFLRTWVSKGDKFWLFLYPGSITSLAHVWTHPSFPAPNEAVGPSKAPESSTPREESEKWLRDLADSLNVTYSDLVERAKTFLHQKRCADQWPEYLVGGAEMESEVTPPEFWDHFEIVTGETAEIEHRSNFFSCSC